MAQSTYVAIPNDKEVGFTLVYRCHDRLFDQRILQNGNYEEVTQPIQFTGIMEWYNDVA